jgi:hypothetical protein
VNQDASCLAVGRPRGERSSWETLGANGKHMENNMENEWKNMRKNMTHEKNICYGKINGTRYMETIYTVLTKKRKH